MDVYSHSVCIIIIPLTFVFISRLGYSFVCYIISPVTCFLIALLGTVSLLPQEMMATFSKKLRRCTEQEYLMATFC